MIKNKKIGREIMLSWPTKSGFKAVVALVNLPSEKPDNIFKVHSGDSIPITRQVFHSLRMISYCDRFYVGYIAIPKGHPFYGKHYDEIDIEVHGGLTFSEFSDFFKDYEDGNAPYWWIGFDFNHYGDDFEIQDIDYAVNECEKMAVQCKEITTRTKNMKQKFKLGQKVYCRANIDTFYVVGIKLDEDGILYDLTCNKDKFSPSEINVSEENIFATKTALKRALNKYIDEKLE